MSDDVALQIPITAAIDGFKSSMEQVKSSVNGAVGNIKNTLSGVRDAFGAVGLMATGYLKGAIDSAAKAETSTQRLKQLIENQGQSWETAGKQVSEFTSGISKMSTYSGGQARDALTTLIQKHVQLKDALTMQNTMVNLAAGKNIDLTQSANILADAYNGKTRALVGLGLATKEEIKHGISFAEVQDRINKNFGGSASAQLNTYAGQMTQLHNNLNSIKVTIGSAFLPFFEKLSGLLNSNAQSISNFVKENKGLVAGILGVTAVFGTFVGGAGLLQKVLSILSPVIGGLGIEISSLLLPVTAVIAGIALFTVAYSKNWGGIKDKTTEVINYIKPFIIDSIGAVINWFKENWPAIKAVFEAVLNAISEYYNNILKPVLKFMVQEFEVVVNWVRENWPLIQKTIETVLNFIKGIIVSVLDWIKSFWKAHGDTIIAVVKIYWDVIKNDISMVINVILDIIKFVMNIITGNWKEAWNNIATIASTIFNTIKANFLELVQAIMSAANSLVSMLPSSMQKGFQGMRLAISSEIDKTKIKLAELHTVASSAIQAPRDANNSSWLDDFMKKIGTPGKGDSGTGGTGLAGAYSTAGGAAKKAAKDSREAWQIAKDSIELNIKILDARFALLQSSYTATTTETQKTIDAKANLVEKIKAVTAEVNVLQGQYDKLTKTKKNNTDEGKNLLVSLLTEMKTLKDLKNSVSSVDTVVKIITDNLQKFQDKINNTTSIIKAKYDLWMSTMSKTATVSEQLQKKISEQTQEMDLAGKQVALLSEAYEKMKKVKGETADETQKLYLQLLQEMKVQQDLKNSIEDATKAQQNQNVVFGKAFTFGQLTNVSTQDIVSAAKSNDYYQEAKKGAWDGTKFVDKPTTGSSTNIASVNVNVHANDLKQVGDVISLFSKLPQTARTLG